MASRIDRDTLPLGFPTHKHSSEFWEALGRVVGTYGFLEEVLGRAIFALTATKEVSEENAEEEVAKWMTVLERALDDPLGNMIPSYEKFLRSRAKTDVAGDIDQLIADLKEAAVLRNALCHGSWQPPDAKGHSVPRYVDKKRGIIETSFDIDSLIRTQQQVARLSCSVMDSVTLLGLKFPGSDVTKSSPVYGFIYP